MAVHTVFLSCLLVTGLIHPSVHTDTDKDPAAVCTRLVEHIYHGHIVAVTPPDLNGLWTSRRCEVRPGPEYLLRRYHFYNNSHFELQQYYYADSDCTKPIFALVSRGTVAFQEESWTVVGGWEAYYELSHVALIPYSDEKAYELGLVLNLTCPGFTKGPWKALERYIMYNYVESDDDHNMEEVVLLDHDCMDVMHVTFHELQLVRLELQSHHQGERRWLYLGDIHTDVNMRAQYRPSSYQEPLALVGERGCRVCKKVAKSDEKNPSILHRRHRPQGSLQGEWFSARCETRPMGMFLTRRLLFHEDNVTWEGYYYHYSDAVCRQPSFTIYARGEYVAGNHSLTVHHAQEFDFRVQQVKVTPEDKGVVYNLNNHKNGNTCGKLGSWRRGVEQDVTHTKGCGPLGIQVPHVEYEITKLEKDHHKILLYLGQRPSESASPSSSSSRPTSFQPPLVRCGDARALSKSGLGDFHVTPFQPNINASPTYGLSPVFLLVLLTLFLPSY